jgi:hypothetical protein
MGKARRKTESLRGGFQPPTIGAWVIASDNAHLYHVEFHTSVCIAHAVERVAEGFLMLSESP